MAERDFNAEFTQIVHEEELTELDPIEQAANDFRMVRAARFILFAEMDDRLGSIPDYHDLLHQVGGDYCLSETEMHAAMEVSEDRQAREYNNGEA